MYFNLVESIGKVELATSPLILLWLRNLYLTGFSMEHFQSKSGLVFSIKDKMLYIHLLLEILNLHVNSESTKAGAKLFSQIEPWWIITKALHVNDLRYDDRRLTRHIFLSVALPLVHIKHFPVAYFKLGQPLALSFLERALLGSGTTVSLIR
jgi:hypothetical protein